MQSEVIPLFGEPSSPLQRAWQRSHELEEELKGTSVLLSQQANAVQADFLREEVDELKKLRTENIGEIRRLTEELERHRERMGLLSRQDQEMRAAVARMQVTWKMHAEKLRTWYEAKTDNLRKERDRAVHRAEQNREHVSRIEKSLANEITARKITNEALETYQKRWTALVDANTRLREMASAVQKENARLQSELNRFGSMSDRDSLVKMNETLRNETERLRAQIVEKSHLERELTELRLSHDRTIQDFARESERYRKLADQDHAEKITLMGRLSIAEQELARLRAVAQQPPPFTPPTFTKDS